MQNDVGKNTYRHRHINHPWTTGGPWRHGESTATGGLCWFIVRCHRTYSTTVSCIWPRSWRVRCDNQPNNNIYQRQYVHFKLPTQQCADCVWFAKKKSQYNTKRKDGKQQWYYQNLCKDEMDHCPVDLDSGVVLCVFIVSTAVAHSLYLFERQRQWTFVRSFFIANNDEGSVTVQGAHCSGGTHATKLYSIHIHTVLPCTPVSCVQVYRTR